MSIEPTRTSSRLVRQSSATNTQEASDRPEQVVEALCVAGGLLHAPLDLVLLPLDEARL